MEAIIEMTKGDDRRRHFKFDKTGFVDLGPIKDVIPVNHGIMPVNYGFIPNTLNEDEGDEVDILVLSEKPLEIGQAVAVEPIALIRRADGDDKVVAVDETMKAIKSWDDVPATDRKSIEEFFSYHHKFLSIDGAEAARNYAREASTVKSVDTER